MFEVDDESAAVSADVTGGGVVVVVVVTVDSIVDASVFLFFDSVVGGTGIAVGLSLSVLDRLFRLAVVVLVVAVAAADATDEEEDEADVLGPATAEVDAVGC